MKKLIYLLPILLIGMYSCNKKNTTAPTAIEEKSEFKNRSNAPSFVTVEPEFAGAVKAFTLISSNDSIAASPGFVYGGAPDGQGFLKILMVVGI